MFHGRGETFGDGWRVSTGMGPTIFFITLVLALGVFMPMLAVRYARDKHRHAERMLAIEKGAAIPPFEPEGAPWTPRVYLLRGLIWLFSGIGLAVFLLGVSQVQPGNFDGRIERIRRVQELRSQGVPESELQQIPNASREGRLPAAFALAGLIPKGVGLAYLIFYFCERKNLSPPVAVRNHPPIEG